MNIRLNKYITSARQVLTRWITVWFFIVLGCSPDYSDDNIPPVNFPDIVLVLNLPSNSSLTTKGGFKEIGGGVRGIVKTLVSIMPLSGIAPTNLTMPVQR
jgi:hypothetical protein